MSTVSLLLLLVGVGAVTFLYRYSMIGLFASRKLPDSVRELCRHIAPASFAALCASALFIQHGAVTLGFDSPRTWAALIAALVALHTRNVIATIITGMLALTLLKLIL
ncbi:AzlD domain-containing protein [Rhodocyclus tenuis]|uniref:AzlD domain-containing protein n=1 Tax=Rhodocyclus gracilis TaxID=2929842 RepID=A0ABX0WGC2_9RHOO|nr:AzlD domain-containing protein [Rhodocyclus gracilis]NJA88783.1 AzlD domain-containing protein [Rhodocyclus gracilis]